MKVIVEISINIKHMAVSQLDSSVCLHSKKKQCTKVSFLLKICLNNLCQSVVAFLVFIMMTIMFPTAFSIFHCLVWLEMCWTYIYSERQKPFRFTVYWMFPPRNWQRPASFLRLTRMWWRGLCYVNDAFTKVHKLRLSVCDHDSIVWFVSSNCSFP